MLRHAKSSWGDPALDDLDRPLNARGRSAAEAIGRELQLRQLAFDLVVASPATRVRQTLERLASSFGALPEIDFRPGIYAAPVERLREVVRSLPEGCESVLLVGHNPGLQQLVLALAEPASPLRRRVAEKYPTAAATVLRFAADGWRAAEGGEITSLILPRELKALQA